MTDMIIVKMQFGSRLYGTATPESDTDLKGVFLPSIREVMLNRVPKSKTINTKSGNDQKNTKDDVDLEMFSLHYFLELACKGETVALDMLHAPDDMILEMSPIWDAIRKERHRFYTRSLKAFVGYARRQASKYGIRGSRLNAAKRVLEFFEGFDDSGWTLADVWEQLPEGSHLHKDWSVETTLRTYQIVGKIFHETVRGHYVIPILRKFVASYGSRAELAARNEGIDWKAISHALRAAYQTEEILIEHKITFPLREAEYLKAVKLGQLDYTTEVLPKLEGLMERVEYLSGISGLPDHADRKYWDDFLYDAQMKVVSREVGNYWQEISEGLSK